MSPIRRMRKWMESDPSYGFVMIFVAIGALIVFLFNMCFFVVGRLTFSQVRAMKLMALINTFTALLISQGRFYVYTLPALLLSYFLWYQANRLKLIKKKLKKNKTPVKGWINIAEPEWLMNYWCAKFFWIFLLLAFFNGFFSLFWKPVSYAKKATNSNPVLWEQIVILTVISLVLLGTLWLVYKFISDYTDDIKNYLNKLMSENSNENNYPIKYFMGDGFHIVPTILFIILPFVLYASIYLGEQYDGTVSGYALESLKLGITNIGYMVLYFFLNIIDVIWSLITGTFTTLYDWAIAIYEKITWMIENVS